MFIRMIARAAIVALLLSLLVGCAGVPGGIRVGSIRGADPQPIPDEMRVINHVIVFMQENRSFDTYFGQMTAYRRANGIPIVSSDGRIDDLSSGTFSNSVEAVGNIPVYHTGSVCTEALTPDWAESHKAIDLANPAAAGPTSPMDGFAQTAHDYGQFAATQGITLQDQTGRRAMGYFDSTDLNYYYFMASQFAMSDAFFSPLPTRTTPNRLYFHAATTQGHVHDPALQLSARTIWQNLDEAGVSWKIYITDNPPFFTYLSSFTYFNQPGTSAHIVPLSEYFRDVQAGTLPSVAFIETGMFSGRDEHPGNFDPDRPDEPNIINIQTGAQFASTLINALMNSPSWQDSVFFWTMDEGGGAYDHVPPISVPSPDGIRPVDLQPTDPVGDFTISGFRVPNIIISPFSRRNFVSHTPMDFTAYLRFIEIRFGLPGLNRRDSSMPDMREFFDFSGKPWATPPTPPAQNTNGTCDFALQ